MKTATPTLPLLPDGQPKKLYVYSVGLVYLSICTRLSPDEAVREVNGTHPTGLDHDWQIADEDFRDGSPNPCQCPDFAEHKHYLLTC